MNVQQKSTAENCLNSSYEGTAELPTVLSNLAAVGIEGYVVDYRKGTTTYFLPDGDNVELNNQKTSGSVAPNFDAVASADDFQYARNLDSQSIARVQRASGAQIELELLHTPHGRDRIQYIGCWCCNRLNRSKNKNTRRDCH